MQGAQVLSLVRKLDPAVKTWCSQINKYFLLNSRWWIQNKVKSEYLFRIRIKKSHNKFHVLYFKRIMIFFLIPKQTLELNGKFNFNKGFLLSPLGSKEIKPINAKGNQPWIFIGRTDAEALIFWPPDVKSWLIGKDPDAGKDWKQEKKGVTEDKMVGWHHWLNGHEFPQTPGDGEEQGSLVCCSPWDHKELGTTLWLNNQ